METVYQYDSAGYYVGETTAYQGLPHNCSTKKPKIQKGHIPQWDGSSWKQVEDHRVRKDERDCEIEGSGTPYWLPEDDWRTSPRYMTAPGPLPENAILSKPERDPKEALLDAKRDKLTEIYGKHDAALIDALLLGGSMDNAEIRATLGRQRSELEERLRQATSVEEVRAIQAVYTL